MDPVATFSLVCGVIQIVDFSTKAVKQCREIYKNGSLSENEEIEDMARHLADLRTNLDLGDQSRRDDVLDLGSKYSSTAQDLVAELGKLNVKGPHGKIQAVKKTFQSVWRRKAIDAIQKRLDEYRKILDTRILIDLRFVLYRDVCLRSEAAPLIWPFEIIFFSFLQCALSALP